MPDVEKLQADASRVHAFIDCVLESHEARAAYDRAELRQLTYGMDRRQARRVRRRYYAATRPVPPGGPDA